MYPMVRQQPIDRFHAERMLTQGMMGAGAIALNWLRRGTTALLPQDVIKSEFVIFYA